MGRMSTLAMVLVAGTACTGGLVAMGAGKGSAAAPAPAPRDLDLPITSITLYRSGVASFERRGTVSGDVNARMSVEADGINDLLKSMVLLDLDGGRVEAVGYESKDPLARRLSSFAVDISDNPGLYTLLERLRGAEVHLETSAGGVQGSVLSVETWPIVEDGVSVQRGFVTLRTGEGLRTVGMHEVRRFRIVDEQLADELRLALDAIGESRTGDVKSVDLAFEGDGQRRVVVSYVQESPVWKASYRLVLPEASASEEATLQGWAIVENTTGEDWEDVRLSLVSGRPVSFTMDLYEPLYIPRYEAPVPIAAGARPRVYEEGRAVLRAEAAPAAAYSLAPRRSNTRDRDLAYAREVDALEHAPDATAWSSRFSGAALGKSVASGGELGEQFHYRLDEPVTVERRRSAMLPILTEPIGARRVSIYNASDSAKHPMRGVELTNSTGLQLLGGPVSVFDAGAYAGDAQIGHVAPEDERLLAYAVDLDVVADTDERRTSVIERVKIVRGVIEQTFSEARTTRYEFTSKDRTRGRTIIVEHPDSGGWDLVEPAEPTEKAGDSLRFEVGLPAGESASLSVTHERTRRHRIGVLDQDIGLLVRWVSQGKASQEVLDAVREAGRLRGAVQEARERLAELDRERDAIAKDQERIRGNLERVSSGTELHDRYLRKLNEQETRLESIAEERAEAGRREVEARRALEEFIAGLDVG